jgi:hypothetical protein
MHLLRSFPPQLQRTRHALTAALLLPVMLAGGVGVPVVPVVRKDLSQPFPCQSCACACRDAQTCWSGCCCLTDEEKLVWARENHVTPPQFVVDRVAAKRTTPCSAAAAGCSRCRQTGQSTTAPHQREQASPSPATLQIVWLSAQRRCQGLDSLTMLLSAALPCLPARPWRPEGSSVALWTAGKPPYLGFFCEPPHPPPRLLVAEQSAGVC